MKHPVEAPSLLLATLLQVTSLALATAPNSESGPPAADIGFRLIGSLATRPACDIASSTWSIGGETLDRDFAIYANYRNHLGPLGAKAIRLQAGWAKCEKTPGVYDWAWLDEIVNDALTQGVQPWIETSYGNPIYPGGGGTGLGAGLPRSPEALRAWDAWVQVLVTRYQDRVHEWEVWNEPDGGHGITAEAFAEFHLRTAAILPHRAAKDGGAVTFKQLPLFDSPVLIAEKASLALEAISGR